MPSPNAILTRECAAHLRCRAACLSPFAAGVADAQQMVNRAEAGAALVSSAISRRVEAALAISCGAAAWRSAGRGGGGCTARAGHSPNTVATQPPWYSDGGSGDERKGIAAPQRCDRMREDVCGRPAHCPSGWVAHCGQCGGGPWQVGVAFGQARALRDAAQRAGGGKKR